MKAIIFSFAIVFSGSIFAHGGGLDGRGCHLQRGVEHCHNKGVEERRLQALHRQICGQVTPEGTYPVRDLYGRRCRPR